MSEAVSTALAASYARWRGSRLGRITDRLEQRLILELTGEVAQRTVLDVGCGDGALAAALARRGARVTGLDADPCMLEAARRRATDAALAVALTTGRAEQLPFADGSFDVVVAVTVLCFVPQADLAIAEMTRVLRPGGRLVIGELGRWNSWAAWRRVRGWRGAPTWRAAQFRSAGELRRMLERHGLTVTAQRGAIFYPPSGFVAALMARIDPWLGRRTTCAAAFIALAAQR